MACWDRDHALWQTLSDLDGFGMEREERWEAGSDTFVDPLPDGFFAQMLRASLFILF